MSHIATIESKPTQQVTKTSGTRLLDLLAGWGDYVGSEEVGDDEQEALIDGSLDSAEIASMYQEAAAEVYELEGDAEAEAVRHWVMEKILPALLRTAKPTIVASLDPERAKVML